MHKNLTRNLPLFVLLALLPGLIGLPVAAMEHPNMARGFSGGVFQSEGIDNISLFNGSLSLVIPIGQNYPVGAGFGHGLNLVYNSNVWDFEEVVEGGQVYLKAIPNPLSNVGLGWMLNLGKILPPNKAPNYTPQWVYIDSSGGSHGFYDQLHRDEDDGSPDTLYTKDGSYLRMTKTGTYSRRVELPDGTKQSFGKSIGWHLTKTEDRFGNEWTISRNTPGDGTQKWTLIDRHGRQNFVHLTDMRNLGFQVKTIDLAGFNGTRSIYTFNYRVEKRRRSCKDTYPGNDGAYNNDRLNLPLLTRITLPDGSQFKVFDGNGKAGYNDLCQPTADISGTIQGIELPTKGRIEWTYQKYFFPGSGTHWLDASTGVKNRILRRKDGTVEGTWGYRSFKTRPSSGEPYDEMRTHVVTPTGDCTKHYFAAKQELKAAAGPWTGWEYGLPMSLHFDSNGIPLSSEIWSSNNGNGTCGGTRLRSTYLQFEHDRLPSKTGEVKRPEWYASNRRVAVSRSEFHDNTERYVEVVNSDFDGLGHYRTTASGSDFRGTTVFDVQTTRTNFNRSRKTYEINQSNNWPTANHTYQVIPPSEAWILGIHDSVERDSSFTVGEPLTRTEVTFDRNTGFLRCARQLKTGTVRGAKDLLVVSTQGSFGQVTRQKLYGGDRQALSTAAGCGTGSLSPVSRVDLTYDRGVPRTAQPFDGGVATAFKTLDVDIDPNTGLAKTSRDPNGQVSTVQLDALGRPTVVVPAEDAQTVYGYAKATATARARITVKRLASNGTALTQAETEFDDFGRPVLQRVLRPGGVWVEQDTAYNARSWVTSTSVPGNATRRTTYLNYDALGRPGIVRPPDGSAHDVRFTYYGAYRTDTQVKTATSPTAETYVKRRRHVDHFGRLRLVQENSGPNGELMTTDYRYDVGGRLTQIWARDPVTLVNQRRRYVYDNRGFLLHELHPEKGANGNGWVYFYDYDARGLVGRTKDGPNQLRFEYDALERITKVRDINQAERLVSQFLYDGAPGKGKAQLWKSIQHNYVTLPWTTTETDVQVTQLFHYGGRSGRPSLRQTTLRRGGFAWNSHFVYNELGQLQSQTYPACVAGQCAGIDPARTLNYTYDQGALTQIGGFTGTIQYHPNGLWKTIPHNNGVTDHLDTDPSGIPRPYRIKTEGAVWAGGNDGDWNTGAYFYDGAGNIKKIAGDTFTYDKVNRLVEGTVGSGAAKRNYTYDVFGNMTQISETRPTGTTTRTFGINEDTNRLTTASYDAAGNVTAWGGQGYDWNSSRQLQSLNYPEWLYFYDAGGERVGTIHYTGSWSTKEETYTLRGLGGEVLRQDRFVGANQVANWSWVRDYVHGPNGLLATDANGEGIRHYSTDHLGSPRLVTDWTGIRKDYSRFWPYGEKYTGNQPGTQPLQFTGHERDDNASGTTYDLDYMHARYFTPHMGRFLSVDPVQSTNPQGLNRYAYVRGNPMNLIDPRGLAGCPPGSENWCTDVFDKNPLPPRGPIDFINFGKALFDELIGLLGPRLPKMGIPNPFPDNNPPRNGFEGRDKDDDECEGEGCGEEKEEEPPPGCVNNSDTICILKKEEGDDQFCRLLPGGTHNGPIDGVKPPAWDGDWLKVLNGDTVVIDKYGNPKVRRASGFDLFVGRLIGRDGRKSGDHWEYSLPVLICN